MLPPLPKHPLRQAAASKIVMSFMGHTFAQARVFVRQHARVCVLGIVVRPDTGRQAESYNDGQ